MKVIVGRPPNFAELDAKFNIRGKPVLFCWGDTIYNPLGVYVHPELRAHEQTHALRQGTDIEGWWRRYIDDEAFRLAEEIPAHRAEYQAFCRKHGNRNQRQRYLDNVLERLCGPLYGSLITPVAAKGQILGASS